VLEPLHTVSPQPLSQGLPDDFGAFETQLPADAIHLAKRVLVNSSLYVAHT
jgi:hypothetical protein